MKTVDSKLVLGSVEILLRELLFGPAPGASWIINPGDAGFIGELAGISAAEASRSLIPNRSSIAGHADHVRFSLQLGNRWAQGEDAYSGADWTSSWKRQAVDETDWEAIRRGLQSEAERWLEVVVQPRDWEPVALTGTIGSAAHVAYHLGALRQLLGQLGARAEGSEVGGPSLPAHGPGVETTSGIE